eukprot:6206401-Pleurochrysis_carterae.AAC.1
MPAARNMPHRRVLKSAENHLHESLKRVDDQQLIARPRQLRPECEPLSGRAGNGRTEPVGASPVALLPVTYMAMRNCLTKRYAATHGWTGRWLPLQLTTTPCVRAGLDLPRRTALPPARTATGTLRPCSPCADPGDTG